MLYQNHTHCERTYHRRRRTLNRILLLTLSLSVSTMRAQMQEHQQLIVFYAGSLAVPFQKIIERFRGERPGVDIRQEIAGSQECARKISELHQPCDVFASADYAVIENLLIPDYADWDLKFATNEMAIVYTEKSRRAKEVNRDNWYDILLDKDVSFGRADPNTDPCGYRTILTMKLAERYYGKPGLAEKLKAKNAEYIRPMEVDMLSLLEVGELDYIFLYRSVAVQHGLRFLLLPDEINLKRTDLEDYYKQASVELNGKRPGEKITQKGSSMVYGVTIPKNSRNQALAESFVQFLMTKGLKILAEMGQPNVVPAVCSTYNKLPQSLRQFAKTPANKVR
ncbi:MAG TPA: tungstate ABC transporter substrate-binding protein WtpA [Bacteroidota bacterium]